MWVAYGVLATARLQLGDYEKALDWARRSLRRHGDHLPAHHVLVASLARLDRQEEAEAALRDLLALDPGLTVAGLRERYAIDGYRNLEGFLDGLKMAGLPEKE